MVKPKNLVVKKLIPIIITGLTLTFFFGASPVKADGGIAMSGSFYQQAFEIPQGAYASGPDIYIVVFNNGEKDFQVNMITDAPPGVELELSPDEFSLQGEGLQQVFVTIKVSEDAVPGEYTIGITAEPYVTTGSGIQLAGAATQEAKLIITGDSATVAVQSTSPDGEPIAATVRLYKIISGRDYEVAYSDNGNLSVKVSPGRFKASSFAGGMLLAEEQFDISANEKKNITLSGATVYFEGFDIVPNYQKDTDILAFVQIVYSLKNVYQRVNQAEVFLQVSLDGSVIDELSLANLNPLETGRIGLNYNYIPSAGWSDGTYEFILRLNIDGKPYASSIAKKLVPGKSVISSESAPAAAVADDAESTSKDGINYVLIGGIAGGVILLIILVFVVVRLARRY